MKIKEYIEKIVENGKPEDMKELSNMLDEAIIKVKITEPECYKKYKMKLMGMAYSYKFNKDMAEELVENMRPLGQYWNIETTSKVKKDYDINADDCDFYIVMNSLANDYYKIIDREDIETYSKMAGAFINDEDAIKNKVWKYFTIIPKED